MTTRSTRSPRRRTVIALAVVLGILAGFIVRLVDIQVVNADEHVADSQSRGLSNSQVIYGSRGAIVDSSGATLAGSIIRYDCQLDPLLISQTDEKIAAKKSSADPWSIVAPKIAAITGQTPEEVGALVPTALAENTGSRFAKLKTGLSTEQYQALTALDESYIACLQHPARTYPDGAVAGNLVGFLGSDGTPLAGVEKFDDSCLEPTNGVVSYEQGKDGVMIPGTETQTAAADGGTVKLTIDRDLQWYLDQLIAEQTQNTGAQSGTISVVEVKTGKVRAMAEYPTVDPNNINGSAKADLYSRIFNNTFEPGSVFKALTAATVIEKGGQNPLSTVVASGTETFANGARVHDAFGHPAYDYTLAGVLIDSSNAGISKFSEKVDDQTRYDMLTQFGIGTGSAISFGGQAKGELTAPSTWDNQTKYNTSYGQGLTTTVPELLGAYETIANDGTKLPLTLVESCTKADGTVVKTPEPTPTRVISEQTATDVQQILENVATQAAYAPDVAVPGYRIATKTGTGEKADGHGGYKNGVYFTTMIGFAPADDPQYLVAVTLDEPTTVRSSAANAPGFQKAMTQVLKTFRVTPSTTTPTIFPKFG